MNTILFLWALAGYTHYQGIDWREYDWRPMGEFASPADCQRAARELALDPKRFRCVTTGKKDKQ